MYIPLFIEIFKIDFSMNNAYKNTLKYKILLLFNILTVFGKYLLNKQWHFNFQQNTYLDCPKFIFKYLILKSCKMC